MQILFNIQTAIKTINISKLVVISKNNALYVLVITALVGSVCLCGFEPPEYHLKYN